MRRIGRGTRLAILAQVGLTVALALVAVVGVNWLAGRPGIRQRFDLTEKGRNTLATATLGVLGRLEREVAVDVFWRGEEFPLTQVAPEAMRRIFELLQLMTVDSPDRVRVTNFAGKPRAEIEARLRELKITGYENCLVVSAGERREVLRFRGELVQFDLGSARSPQGSVVPPTIRAFPAEERIVQAILAVTTAESSKVLFTTGQGEPALDDAGETGLGRLVAALRDEALEAVAWEFEKDPTLPLDCVAIAVLAPEAPFAQRQLETILKHVDAGGGLVVAPAWDSTAMERSDVPELLAHYGIEARRGLVLEPYPDALGQAAYGDARLNSELVVYPPQMTEHPITRPFREAGRSLRAPRVHPVRVIPGRQPQAGTSMPLLTANPTLYPWIDLPPHDWQPRVGVEEIGERIGVCVVSQFVPDRPDGAGPATAGPLEEKPEVRIFALGGADAFTNAYADHDIDFARNAFNWVASREYRVSISPRDPDQRRLPLGQGDVLAGIRRVAVWWLPGLCLLLGASTAVARRRGGPRSTSEASA